MTGRRPHAAIYTRVASPSATTDLNALQAEQCRALAEERGWDVVGIYNDNGPLPKERLPPGLAQLRDAIGRSEIEHVIMARPDRLGRTGYVRERSFTALVGAGAAVHFAQEPVSLPYDPMSDPTGSPTTWREGGEYR